MSDWSDRISDASRDIDRLLSDIGSDKSGGGVLADTFVKGGFNRLESSEGSISESSGLKSGFKSDPTSQKIEDIIKRALK